MTSKTAKTKVLSPQEQDVTDTKERVAELETLVSALRFELDEMTVECDALQERYNAGYDVDVDRLAELRDALIPRREDRLKMLETETLPEAKRDAERAVLLELASRDADGISGRYETYAQRVADAEAKVTEALAEARAAAAEWSDFINDVSERAQAAGLSDVRHLRGDYTEHPISYVASAVSGIGFSLSNQPVPVKVGGETYQAVNGDAVVRRTVSQADPHIKRLVIAARDADIIAEGQRVQALTSR